MATHVHVKERPGGVYTTEMQARDHKIYVDEPESLGGVDLGPTPVELVLGGLGACTTITLRMYAKRKKWPVTQLETEVHYKKSGFPDESGEMKNVFIRVITIEGELDETQRQRMLEIANKCPVHKILEGEAEIRTELV